MLHRRPCKMIPSGYWSMKSGSSCALFSLHPPYLSTRYVSSGSEVKHLQRPSSSALGWRTQEQQQGERERDGQEVLIARTELGNSEINSIFSSGCITNCWAREENRCGLVGSRINSLEIKSQMASWKLPTLGRSKRALTEEGITLCPSKRNGNLTVCLSLLHTQERKKRSSTAFFEIPHDIKVIPTIRRVLSFLHFWNLESCVRFKPYKAVAPLDYPSECVVSCLCDCIHWGCRSDLSWQATHVSNCRHVFLLKLLFAWCLPGDAKSKSAQKQY